MGKLHSGKKERFQVWPDWRLLAWEAEGELSRSGISSVSGGGWGWGWGAYLACSDEFKVGSKDKN